MEPESTPSHQQPQTPLQTKSPLVPIFEDENTSPKPQTKNLKFKQTRGYFHLKSKLKLS
jgi:hypothetical protein